MTARWSWLAPTPGERQRFPDLASVLALPWTPAAPPNRLRHVRRIELDGEVCYLKVFTRTQWKNQFRALWAPPRVRLDAARESAIAQALQARGFATARGIACGSERGTSVYLCAALPGPSLRERLQAPGARRLLLPAARWAGAIARAGILLPDLALEHVRVLGESPPRFAVLDLHNGRFGRARARDARRWLRRLAREAAALPLAPRAALGAAAAFLRAAGFGRARRALLRRLPLPATHLRYELPGRSRRYRDRNPARQARELALLARVWPGRAGERVLDVPCGAGRFAAVVGAQWPGRWFGCDRAAAMAREAAIVAPGRVAVADAARLPLADRGADGLLLFRFLHHLEPAAARAVVAEATRAAARFVVVSHFVPWSLHGLRRRVAGALLGRPVTRHAVAPGELARWFAAAGFAPAGAAAEPLRELRIAAFVRRPG